MSVTAGVSEAAIAVRDKLRGKIGQTKVKRYWPGKAPDWAADADDDADLRTAPSRSAALERAFPARDDDDGALPAAALEDRRLRRLVESRVENKEELRADHRRIRHAEIVSAADEAARLEEAEDEDDDDAVEERRRRLREKNLRREQEEAALLPVEEEDEAEEEEEESEYETDSDEEPGVAIVKPIFVPKAERDTIAERERLEEEERLLEAAVKRRLEERKAETKQIVVEEIRKEEQIQKNLETDADIADVNTDDEMNEAEEYEAWKGREIARIKKDREIREAQIKEKEEIERVRNMTEEERRDWERKNPKPGAGPKQKWKFMQKYYHKGAFFQSETDDYAGTAGSDRIYERDFSAPTGEDKMDKSILPKVMQVKHFGRSGRTKWTHLVNEDTTDWNSPWSSAGSLQAKYHSKMGGMNGAVERPKGSKRMQASAQQWSSK